MTAESSNESAAVWWFVGATFAFISTTLFFPDMPGWFQIGMVILGVLLMIVGLREYFRELNQRRARH